MSTSVKTTSMTGHEPIDSSSTMAAHATGYVAFLQGIYFFVTGIWPLFSIDTFQMVTGPKTDLWLVQTVGALIGVVGAVLLVAGWRRHTTAEVILLALGSAFALGAVDVIFVVRHVIAPIYLLDAVAEGGLVVLWLIALALEARTLWKRSDTCL